MDMDSMNISSSPSEMIQQFSASTANYFSAVETSYPQEIIVMHAAASAEPMESNMAVAEFEGMLGLGSYYKEQFEQNEIIPPIRFNEAAVLSERNMILEKTNQSHADEWSVQMHENKSIVHDTQQDGIFHGFGADFENKNKSTSLIEEEKYNYSGILSRPDSRMIPISREGSVSPFYYDNYNYEVTQSQQQQTQTQWEQQRCIECECEESAHQKLRDMSSSMEEEERNVRRVGFANDYEMEANNLSSIIQTLNEQVSTVSEYSTYSSQSPAPVFYQPQQSPQYIVDTYQTQEIVKSEKIIEESSKVLRELGDLISQIWAPKGAVAVDTSFYQEKQQRYDYDRFDYESMLQQIEQTEVIRTETHTKTDIQPLQPLELMRPRSSNSVERFIRIDYGKGDELFSTKWDQQERYRFDESRYQKDVDIQIHKDTSILDEFKYTPPKITKFDEADNFLQQAQADLEEIKSYSFDAKQESKMDIHTDSLYALDMDKAYTESTIPAPSLPSRKYEKVKPETKIPKKTIKRQPAAPRKSDEDEESPYKKAFSTDFIEDASIDIDYSKGIPAKPKIPRTPPIPKEDYSPAETLPPPPIKPKAAPKEEATLQPGWNYCSLPKSKPKIRQPIPWRTQEAPPRLERGIPPKDTLHLEGEHYYPSKPKYEQGDRYPIVRHPDNITFNYGDLRNKSVSLPQVPQQPPPPKPIKAAQGSTLHLEGEHYYPTKPKYERGDRFPIVKPTDNLYCEGQFYIPPQKRGSATSTGQPDRYPIKKPVDNLALEGEFMKRKMAEVPKRGERYPIVKPTDNLTMAGQLYIPPKRQRHASDGTPDRFPMKKPVDNLTLEGQFYMPAKAHGTSLGPDRFPIKKPKDNLTLAEGRMAPKETQPVYRKGDRADIVVHLDSLRMEGAMIFPDKSRHISAGERPKPFHYKDNLKCEGEFPQKMKSAIPKIERPQQIRHEDNLTLEKGQMSASTVSKEAFSAGETRELFKGEKANVKIAEDNLKMEGNMELIRKSGATVGERAAVVKHEDNLTIGEGKMELESTSRAEQRAALKAILEQRSRQQQQLQVKKQTESQIVLGDSTSDSNKVFERTSTGKRTVLETRNLPNSHSAEESSVQFSTTQKAEDKKLSATEEQKILTQSMKGQSKISQSMMLVNESDHSASTAMKSIQHASQDDSVCPAHQLALLQQQQGSVCQLSSGTSQQIQMNRQGNREVEVTREITITKKSHEDGEDESDSDYEHGMVESNVQHSSSRITESRHREESSKEFQSSSKSESKYASQEASSSTAADKLAAYCEQHQDEMSAMQKNAALQQSLDSSVEVDKESMATKQCAAEATENRAEEMSSHESKVAGIESGHQKSSSDWSSKEEAAATRTAFASSLRHPDPIGQTTSGTQYVVEGTASNYCAIHGRDDYNKWRWTQHM